METSNMRDLDLLYYKSQTVYNKVHSRTPLLYKNANQLLNYLKNEQQRFGNKPNSYNYNMGHSLNEYENLLKDVQREVKKMIPKQDEIVETFNSKFLKNSNNEKELIKNVRQKQEEEIYNKMKEAMFHHQTQSHCKINNYFIKNWNRNLEQFKSLIQQKEDKTSKKHKFVDSFKISFNNSVILENSFIQEDLCNAINSYVHDYAVFKNNLKRHEQKINRSQNITNQTFTLENQHLSQSNNQQLLKRQYMLLKKFVDANKNQDLKNSLRVIEQQFRSLKDDNGKIKPSKLLIKTSCKILEHNFLVRLKPYSNVPHLQYANGQLRNIYGYLMQDYLVREDDVRSKMEFKNEIPLWAIVYFVKRAGLDKDLQEYLNRIEDDFYDQDFQLLKSLIVHEGKIVEEYNNFDAQTSLSNKIFKNLLYYIFGLTDNYDEFPFDEMWDFLWLQLKRCYYSKDLEKDLQLLQKDLDKEEKKVDDSVGVKLLVFSLTMLYQDMLAEMMKNPEMKYQAMVLLYFLIETKLIDEDMVTKNTGNNLRLQFVEFVKDISNQDSLLGLSYLSCFENANSFAQKMTKIFKNNDKLLNEYFNSDTSSQNRLSELKKIFDQNKLGYFYDHFLQSQESENKFYKPIWYIRMVQEVQDFDQMFVESAKAFATQIYLLLQKDQTKDVPDYYLSSVQHLDKNWSQLNRFKNKKSFQHYLDAQMSYAMKNLLTQYQYQQISRIEFLVKLRENCFFDVSLHNRLQSTIYIYCQLIKITLQAIEQRLCERNDRLTRRSIGKNNQVLIGEIMQFVDEQLRPIEYRQSYDCFNFDLKKNIEDIEDLARNVQKFLPQF